MKKLLLAGAMAMLLPAAAHAQAAVYCVNCSTLINQVMQFAQEISNLESQLQQQEEIFAQLQRAVNPNTYASELQGMQQPFNTGSLTQVFSGFHTGNVYPGASTFTPDTQIYQVPGTDWQATELNGNAQGLANVQAVMNQQLQSINSHISGLQDLRSQLSSVTSQADLTALNGRIQAESADISSQGVQMQALQSQVVAENAVNQQRDMQEVRRSDDELTTTSAFPTEDGANITPNSTPSSAFVASNN